MNITLSDHLSQASANTNIGTLETKSAPNTLPDGQSFGQFMSEMLQLQAETSATTAQEEVGLAPLQGQEIAASQTLAQLAVVLDTQGSPLKAMTLGPNLSVITPETAPPDSQSLEAFARAQGLDETAVSWLFGGQAGAMPAAPTPPLSGANALTTNQANASNSTEDALPIQMLRMPSPAAVWMQRSQMNNVLQSSVSAQKEATISLSELDLGPDWGGETLQQLLGAEGGASSASSTGTHGTAYANFASRWDAQTNNRTDLSNANGPAPDLPDANARSENIQNLADKMGQAVGQRILSEMEKGQWHLKLQLRPATLGHIEVEMRMRSGEFDAVFTAPNATTRDLLQDGMSKLRETLSQMGMDIAGIHVGDGQTGQSGGDPTPGSSKGKPAQAQASAPASTAEISRAPRVKDPNDGLDVLV